MDEFEVDSGATAIVDVTGNKENEEEVPIPAEVDGTKTVRDPNRDQGRLSLGKSGDNVTTSSHEEDEPVDKKRCFGLKKLICEADKSKWELPPELAEHYLYYTRKHMSDSDMKVNLEEQLVPTNAGAVPVMDANFRGILKKEGKNGAVDIDNDWECKT